MRLFALALVVVLAGCATGVPVKREFPPQADSLKTGCPDLALIAIPTDPLTQVQLSEILEVVTANYAEYHSCRAKVDAWLDWYTKQQKIFNESQ